MWPTIFTFAKEFGWSVQYTMKELPILWVKKLTEQLIEYAEMEKAAAKGHRAIPKSELTDDRLEEKNRKLAKAQGLNYDEIVSNSIYG